MASIFQKTYCRTFQTCLNTAVNFLDWSEPNIIRGNSSVLKLADIISSKGLKKVLIVTGPNIRKRGLINPLCDKLTQNSVEFEIYSDTQANPSIENIEAARNLYINTGCQAVIAFGGGSPMDCAKVAAARVTNPKLSVRDMRGLLKLRRKMPPFFAVPTTAGTGSEATIAAVVTDTETHEKYAVTDPKLKPDYAVLDPTLTVALPPHITSTTGMDALTHAVEAYIGHANTKSTSENAEKAVKLIFENLETAYRDGENLEARDNMLYSSYLAGLAFTRAYVGYVHAIAHAVGGLYSTPHGLANAVILPYVLDYFGDSAYPALARLADCAGLDTQGRNEEQKAKIFIQAIRSMNERMEIPAHLDCIRSTDVSTIVKRALKEANPLYPVPKIMDKIDCEAVVLKIKG